MVQMYVRFRALKTSYLTNLYVILTTKLLLIVTQVNIVYIWVKIL